MTDRQHLHSGLGRIREGGIVPVSVTLAVFLWSALHPALAWALPVRSTERPATANRTPVAPKLDVRSRSSAASAPASVNPSSQAVASRKPVLGPVAPPAPPKTTLSLPKGNNSISAQAIALPSGAATSTGMGESFSAQLTTGIATYSVPFGLPAARGNVQPALGLVYASSGGYGVAGVGWSLVGDVFIARQTDRGVPRYGDQSDWYPGQDHFVFGAEELVPICTVSGGACTGALDGEVMPVWAEGWQYFRARVEGSFLRFFWSPDHRTWRVQSKDGANMELGMPLDGTPYAGALEADPGHPERIYRWHLVRQYDAHGQVNQALPKPVNAVVYRYLHDAGIAYLSDIFDTPPASDPTTTDLSTFAHHAHLDYDYRPDATTSYRAGFAQTEALRLAGVEVTSKPFKMPSSSARRLVRRYHLDYDGTTHASMLLSVQLEGRCSSAIQEGSNGLLGSTSCPRLPKLSFGYSTVDGPAAPLTDSQGLAFEHFNETLHTLPHSPPYSLDESDVSLMDVNADGLPDVVVTAPAFFGGDDGLYLNGDGGALGFSGALGMTVSGVSDVDTGVLRLSNPNVSGLDLDGDGHIDLVHMPKVKQYSVFTPELVGGQWTWAGRSITTASGDSPKIDFTKDADRIAVLDVNGDGLVDVVFSSATEMQTFFALGRYPRGDGRFGHATRTGPDTAELSDDPVTACVPWSATPIQFGDSDTHVADMNGDGLPDIVRIRDNQVLYWPGRGNGYWGTGDRDSCAAGTFDQGHAVQMANPPHLGIVDPGGLRVADVNGDGLADILEVRFDGVDIYLNDNGTGWTERHILANVPLSPNGGDSVRVSDIDGSGTPDIVWGNGYKYQYVDLAGDVHAQVLNHVDNGLGATTDLQYSTSTQLMLDAAAAGNPWTKVMPLSVPVVVKKTVHDNLDKIGRSPGAYVTEYSYRDPVYDGLQREFRGFSVAQTTSPGDATAPTSTTRSTFLMGECRAPQSGPNPCTPDQRWRDNWREPLKGLPVLVETFDETGVYLSSSHSTYELRQLYAGRDGRRVSVALPVGKQTFKYDTSPFKATSVATTLDEVVDNIDGVQQTDTRTIPRRAQGYAEIKSHRSVDSFGDPIEQVAEGCVAGCTSTDEVITTHTAYARPDDDLSGWLFRPASSYVTGSAHPEARHQVHFDYSSDGDLAESHATLWGTLPLDRFHQGGGAVAPPPPNASGGVDAPVDVVTMQYDRDAFGNVVGTRAPVDRCRQVDFDLAYSEFPVEERIYAGQAGSNGCGTRVLTTTGSYDRGFGLITDMVSMTGQPAHLDYDGFGRVVQRTFADPRNPGQLAALPSVTYAYSLPDDPGTTPYSSVTIRTQDGPDTTSTAYREQRSFVDGLGRPLAILLQADASAGDGGDWVVSGVADFNTKGMPFRSYQNAFYTGSAASFPIGSPPQADSTTRLFDAFGRPTYAFGLDGQVTAHTDYHALSEDVWDADDLSPGPHQGTFMTAAVDGHGRGVRTTSRIHVNGVLEKHDTLRDYLPTGEVTRITQHRAGSPDVVRWMRYDSLGRMVLNVEPNTSTGFTTDANADPDTIKAWRYAYNDAGGLVGTSDARGCGVNYHFDAAGRMIAEDYSPCEDSQPPYTPITDFSTGAGAEAFYRYDLPDPESATIVDAAGHPLPTDPAQLLGRIVSISDRGSKGVISYDDRGRVTGTAVRIAQPGGADPSEPSSYAPRWYVQQRSLDAAGRTVDMSTGATVPELLGPDNASILTTHYSQRGMVESIDSSYGPLVTSRTYAADGLPLSSVFGDAAHTQRAYSYDQLRRLSSVQTFRAAPGLWTTPTYSPATEQTQQLLLEDEDLSYDRAGNVTKITDWRTPDAWPAGAKPVTRTFEYDDFYRLTRARYDYPGGSDSWTDPYAAEDADPARQPQPSPHMDFAKRVQEQRYTYDHLGNMTQSSDDASGFFDRSLGTITNGTATAGPNRLVSASDRTTSSARKGDLGTRYDAAGDLTGLVVRRDGPCLPQGASCWQRFEYQWDEVGHLSDARRWDLKAGAERNLHSDLGDPPPQRPADVQLRYVYDAGGHRVIKTAIDKTGQQVHTVYVFSTLELRHAAWAPVGKGAHDYTLASNTERVLLPAGELRGRVVYAQSDLPDSASGRQHVFLEGSDYLGSTTYVIDRATGELVENASYMAYGAAESDYRPGRWGSFREPYRFTGKEEDIEVGLQYFGARYLVVGLGRWASADPAAVQAPSGMNPYAYVQGSPTMAVDPSGAVVITLGVILTAAIVGALVGGGASAALNIGTQWYQRKNFSKIKWGEVGIAAGIGAISGFVSGPTGAVAGSWATSAALAPWIAGGIAGGTAGAVGGATSYLIGAAASHRKVDPGQLGISAAVGLGAGAATGAVSAALTAPEPMGPPKPGIFKYDSPTFNSRKAADTWFRNEFGASSAKYNVEYHAEGYEPHPGKYSFRNFFAGEPGSDAANPTTQLRGLGWTIHTHGNYTAEPSVGVFDPATGRPVPGYEGDIAQAEAYKQATGRSIPGRAIGANGDVYTYDYLGNVNRNYIFGPTPTRIGAWWALGAAPSAGIGMYLGYKPRP